MGNQDDMIGHAFVFYSLTPGRCGYGPNVAELCGALRSAHSPLAERRQMVRDQLNADLYGERTIECVTQVRLTPAIIDAAGAMKYAPGAATARAILEAAGFEVIE